MGRRHFDSSSLRQNVAEQLTQTWILALAVSHCKCKVVSVCPMLFNQWWWGSLNMFRSNDSRANHDTLQFRTRQTQLYIRLWIYIIIWMSFINRTIHIIHSFTFALGACLRPAIFATAQQNDANRSNYGNYVPFKRLQGVVVQKDWKVAKHVFDRVQSCLWVLISCFRVCLCHVVYFPALRMQTWLFPRS